MFKKKKTGNVSVLTETYVPMPLPKYGKSLDTFITGDYRLLSSQFIRDRYEDCEEKISGLINTCDRYTLGDAFDAIVEGQMAHVEALHREDVASHDLQVEHIRSGIAVRKEALERQIPQLEEKKEQLKREIEPLKGLRPQFEFRLGRFHISLGLLVTIAAIIVDFALNYSFLESVLFQNQALLIITTICMAFMSDFSMYLLGSLISRKDEDFMAKWLYRTCCIALVGVFLLTVISSILIRIGTMDITFMVPDADGVLVAKESFSLADWGVTLVTSFLTTSTALFSLAASVDKNAHLVSRRRGLEADLAAADAEHQALVDERNALDKAVDPAIRDLECRKAAEENLEALRVGLKHHVRKLLALHQNQSAYTDAMATSAAALLPPHQEGQPAPEAADNNPTNHTNTQSEEAA